MKKYIFAVLVAAFAITGLHAQEARLSITPAFLQQSNSVNKADKNIVLAQAKTTTVETSAPVTSTTTVKGGNLAAQIIEWLQIAFGSTIGAAFLWVVLRGLKLIGINITAEQKSQLQGIIVNGLNAAAAKAQVALKDNDKLDISIKSQVVADAVAYTQSHAAETIKALGLDPTSGDAVEAIKARIETALNDPTTPTPPVITPATGMPQVNGVVINGATVS